MALAEKNTLFAHHFSDPGDWGSRGEPYLLKRPNVFVGSASEGVLQPGDQLLSLNNLSADSLTHKEVQDVFRNSGTVAQLEVGRSDRVDTEMLSHQGGPDSQVQSPDDQVLQAKQLLTETLSPLLAPSHRGVPMLPRTSHVPQGPPHQEPHSDEVPLVCQPYRTTPLVLPHAKTIHDTIPASKFLNQHPETAPSQPYRNSCVALPAPRTINDLSPREGAPVYRQYRGPQYNTQIQHTKSANKNAVYNSPASLYSEENLTDAASHHPGYVQSSKPHLPSSGAATISQPHESDTFRMILESEMGSAKDCAGVGGKNFEKSAQERPLSQQSNVSAELRDPVMKNTSINQSASFKRVMHSVMGETEF